MALLTTFSEFRASPGIRLFGALFRGWARSVSSVSVRPPGAAFGGLQFVSAGGRCAFREAALSAAGRTLFDGGPHTCQGAGGDLSRAAPLVARVLRQAVGFIRGRGSALDRRINPGVPWAFHPGGATRPNPHHPDQPSGIQSSLAGAGSSNDFGA